MSAGGLVCPPGAPQQVMTPGLALRPKFVIGSRRPHCQKLEFLQFRRLKMWPYNELASVAYKNSQVAELFRRAVGFARRRYAGCEAHTDGARAIARKDTHEGFVKRARGCTERANGGRETGAR